MAAARNEFKLIGPSGTEWYNPSAVTLSCRLSAEISAVNMEIRWFKETCCVCVYKNGHVTEGRGYEGRVSLFTQEMERGNVSLQLRDCRGSDVGHYLCQVTDGDRTEEITVLMRASVRRLRSLPRAGSAPRARSPPEEVTSPRARSPRRAQSPWRALSPRRALLPPRARSPLEEVTSWRALSPRRALLPPRARSHPPLNEEFEVLQGDREWTEDERVEMEKSARLIEDFREPSGTGKGAQSTSTLHPDAGHVSADTEIFTPELVDNYPNDKNRMKYRFFCSRAGHFKCKLTDLVFEMEGKGEVLYRIVSWDGCVSDGLQKDSAGPLYSIECLEGSIRHLHLPHCETCTDVVKLTVAHATGGNVEIIQPLKVTDTHVIIHIHGLSLFGILKALLFQEYPIRAQVLLFRKKMTGKLSRSKLNIHLLPGNVPVKEVQKQRECNEYIETTSKCQLTPGKLYRLCCKTTDRDYEPQPEEETFDLDYGPNYHPTFEVLFNTELDEITLSLLDENGQQVWTPREVSLLTDTEAVSANTDKAGADFVDKHRETLIQSVPSVIEIADVLKGKKMISDEMYYKIESKEIRQEQMRELYRCLTSTAVKAEFYKILQEKHQYILEDL